MGLFAGIVSGVGIQVGQRSFLTAAGSVEVVLVVAEGLLVLDPKLGRTP